MPMEFCRETAAGLVVVRRMDLCSLPRCSPATCSDPWSEKFGVCLRPMFFLCLYLLRLLSKPCAMELLLASELLSLLRPGGSSGEGRRRRWAADSGSSKDLLDLFVIFLFIGSFLRNGVNSCPLCILAVCTCICTVTCTFSLLLNTGQSQTINQSLWGNYSIPKDNPFADDSDLLPEIWALGFANPWRCSFDSQRPSYFYCGDVGQDAYEEVDLITKGGNYGWRVYEGPYIYHPKTSPGGNTSLNSINAIFPVMGYDHSTVNKAIGSASITGGYVYRGSADPCLYGRYLYTDLYSSLMWTGTETPEGSGNYTSAVIPLSCSKSSPIACESTAGSTDPLLGYIFSFGEDNSKDVFVLASKGVYRVVRPSLCAYACPAEKLATNNGTSSLAAPAMRLGKSVAAALALVVFVVLYS